MRPLSAVNTLTNLQEEAYIKIPEIQRLTMLGNMRDKELKSFWTLIINELLKHSGMLSFEVLWIGRRINEVVGGRRTRLNNGNNSKL